MRYADIKKQISPTEQGSEYPCSYKVVPFIARVVSIRRHGILQVANCLPLRRWKKYMSNCHSHTYRDSAS